MKTRRKPSRLTSKSSLSAGSKGYASTPLERSASRIARPEISEMSRSAEGPPISTATLPKSLAMDAIPDDAHFANEVDAGFRGDRRVHVIDERLDVGRARSTGIHDEVRMLRRHLRAPDRMALQPARLDEARGVVAFGIAKDAARVRLVERLRGDAAREELAHARHRLLLVAWLESEGSFDEPLFEAGFRSHVAIADLVVGARARVPRAAAVDGLHRDDVIPRLAAVAAGVHRECPADRSGDPRHPFGTAPGVLRHVTPEMRGGNAGTG